ncbi:hypothetical protein ACVWYN_001955 [Pedobacter sp. UYP24]
MSRIKKMLEIIYTYNQLKHRNVMFSVGTSIVTKHLQKLGLVFLRIVNNVISVSNVH